MPTETAPSRYPPRAIVFEPRAHEVARCLWLEDQMLDPRCTQRTCTRLPCWVDCDRRCWVKVPGSSDLEPFEFDHLTRRIFLDPENAGVLKHMSAPTREHLRQLQWRVGERECFVKPY